MVNMIACKHVGKNSLPHLCSQVRSVTFKSLFELAADMSRPTDAIVETGCGWHGQAPLRAPSLAPLTSSCAMADASQVVVFPDSLLQNASAAELGRTRMYRFGPCPEAAVLDLSSTKQLGWALGSFVNRFPTVSEVDDAVSKRLVMDWRDLAQHTLHLGIRHPLLLAAVRTFEDGARDKWLALKALDQARRKKKRNRVLKAMFHPRVRQGRNVFIADEHGTVQQKITRKQHKSMVR